MCAAAMDENAKAVAKNDPVIVARAVRTRGLRGELVAELLTDFPERFSKTTTLLAICPSQSLCRVELEAHWFQSGRVILKLAGVDSIETAQAFVGCSFGIPETEATLLDADEYYDWQLESCQVETIDGVLLGVVREVLHTGGVPVLLIEGEGGREHLVPLAKTICTEVDTTRKLIRVDAPEGLLELDH